RGADDGGVKAGPLSQCRADQQAAVGPAGDGQLLRGGPAVPDQRLGGGVEVVEYVLLAVEHTGPEPVLALLVAAAQSGDRVDAARRHPGQDVRRVRGGEADVEAAVPV